MSDGTYTAKKVLAALSPVFSTNIFPQIAPDNQAPPYGVYSQIASTPSNTLADGMPIDADRIQVDTYSKTYMEAHTLAQAARDAMLAIAPPISVVFTMQVDGYETTVKLHRVMQEFSVWIQRSSNP